VAVRPGSGPTQLPSGYDIIPTLLVSIDCTASVRGADYGTHTLWLRDYHCQHEC